ncbi:Hypothetical Protein FCC1311_077592 [Hondaea fermentalgiana]|uniref:ApaG domain-containing protein n=1 Tax=Hondaea fermentalgiana TaxID=2315210 RepID=A0A2R5GLM6_9STRA|nr:Hypothetical Protein FCC1311_077592 [Hondaea fermentalgiana]|eukprot:GBG31535.1 Hypothetical Protein FCC1311_077592 [Hondaea fermentalgiana]
MNLATTMYRLIVRDLRHSGTGGWAKLTPVLIPDPIAEDHFGTGRMLFRTPTLQDRVELWQDKMALDHDIVAEWANDLTSKNDDPPVNYHDLVKLAHMHFKNIDAGLEVMERSTRVLQSLPSFWRMARASQVHTTEEGIRLELTATNTSNIPGSSWFLYRVRLCNIGPNPMTTYRILGRHWIFRNEEGEIEAEVERFADGVVGLKPELINMANDSGQVFEYVSGAELTTRSGSLEGALLAENVDTGKTFEIPIKHMPLLSSTPAVAQEA